MKKAFVLIGVIVSGLIALSLYSTYAMYVSVSNDINMSTSLSYEFNIDNQSTFKIPANKVLHFNAIIKNPYDASLKYGIYHTYTSSNSNVIIGEVVSDKSSVTVAPSTSGSIDANKTITIPIAVINKTSSEISVSFGVIYGYINNDITYSSNQKLITSTVNNEDVYNESCVNNYQFDESTCTVKLENGNLNKYCTVMIGQEKIKPNAPVLAEGMIPIKWDGSKWVKASSTNSNNDWYDYDEKKWANAVMVSSATRSSYMSNTTKPVGSEVLEDDILAYYVWIPRYSYQLFNVNSEIMDPIEIQVGFANKTDTKSTGSTNGSWLTHPAFTFGTEELSGIWVGKFETSGTASAPTIKPNLTSLTNLYVSTLFATSQKFGTSAYLNGTTDIDAHMMKNTEWGAVAYLKQSKYGLGTTDIGNNAYYASRSPYYMAGCGPASETDLTSETTTCTSYTSSAGVKASTTGNVYGVYDMAGGAWEYVMGMLKTEDGTGLTYSSSRFTASTLPLGSKYVDAYTYGTSSADYTRRILGDATGETNKWYSDYASFPNSSNPNSPNSFFKRGGSFNSGSSAGVFDFTGHDGGAFVVDSFRSTLATQ